MKKIILLLVIVPLSIPCFAQRPAEWLNQQNTQTKYLLQQIALFQLYLGYVQKGYSIAQKGLTTIGQTKNQEWQLHADYISSLEKINPIIRNSPKVAVIISWQISIYQTCKSTLQEVKLNGQLHPSEIVYVQRVMANLLRESAGDVEGMLAVMTPHQWEMTDNERLNRIDELYEAMQDELVLAQQVANEVKVLSMQLMKDMDAVKTSRSLYGFKMNNDA